MDNDINITGNLTRDPELRFTASGMAVANLGIAVNNRYQVNGEWQSDVCFFNVVAWRELGENAAASLKKGDRVHVGGRMQQRSYDTAGGDHRTVYELVANDINVSLRFARIESITKTTVARPAAEADSAPVEEPV